MQRAHEMAREVEAKAPNHAGLQLFQEALRAAPTEDPVIGA